MPDELYQHDYSTPNPTIGNYDPAGAISIQIPDPETAELVHENYDNLDPWAFQIHWSEFPQGHFYWDFIDTLVKKCYQYNHRPIMYPYGHPTWSHGNFLYTVGCADDDEYNRPCDERVKSYFIRNLINRYRKGGKFTLQFGDWGVMDYIYDNEPGAPGEGYLFYNCHTGSITDNSQAMIAIAMKMLYNYQITKAVAASDGIGEDIRVINPNFNLCMPIGCLNPGPDNAPDYGPATYFDYLSYITDMEEGWYYNNQITELYNDYCFNFPADKDMGAMQRYSDILDFQIGCLTGDWEPADPLFSRPGDMHQTFIDLADYYQYYEIDKVKNQSGFNGVAGYTPNKNVISLESTVWTGSFADATNVATFTGMFSMKPPTDPDYSDLFIDFFPNFGTAENPVYKNVLYRRGFIGVGLDGYHGLTAENLMAGILKDRYSGPIRFEPGTYRTGTGLELLPPSEDNSFYLSQNSFAIPEETTPPTICYFAYFQPNYNTTYLQMRTVEGASNVSVEVPVFYSPSMPLPVRVHLNNDEGFFSQRWADMEVTMPYDPNMEGYYYGYEMNIGEISKATLISSPDFSFMGTSQQGVHLSALGEGWNIVSFNRKPPDVTWVYPYDYIFYCNSLFTGVEWSMLEQIENWWRRIFDPDDPIGSELQEWNMGWGYKMKVEENKLYVIENGQYFEPQYGINLTGITAWWPDPENHDYYRFFAGYYPNFNAEFSYAFDDMIDNANIRAIKDDAGRYMLKQGENYWRGNLDMAQPGKGYRLLFTSADVMEEIDPPAISPFYTYPSTPESNSIIPGGDDYLSAEISSANIPHFAYIIRTPEFFPNIIDSIYVEGIEPEYGDQVGVFTPEGMCVG
nr:hypothetical protein [FCB group bacterium]